MLEQVLNAVNNWFCVEQYDVTLHIENGTCELPLKDGQYFRIFGSVFNDGLHQYPAHDLAEEDFSGRVWALAVPPAVIQLAADIEAWEAQNGGGSPFQSESFGGYSYTRATDSETGNSVTWKSAFRQRLNAWRKL